MHGGGEIIEGIPGEIQGGHIVGGTLGSRNYMGALGTSFPPPQCQDHKWGESL